MVCHPGPGVHTMIGVQGCIYRWLLAGLAGQEEANDMATFRELYVRERKKRQRSVQRAWRYWRRLRHEEDTMTLFPSAEYEGGIKANDVVDQGSALPPGAE